MSSDDLIWISIDDLICIMSLDGLIPSLGGGIATHKNLHQIAILVTKPLHFRVQIHDVFSIPLHRVVGWWFYARLQISMQSCQSMVHDIHNIIFANISPIQPPLLSLELMHLFTPNSTGVMHINTWLYVVLFRAITVLRTISSCCTSS